MRRTTSHVEAVAKWALSPYRNIDLGVNGKPKGGEHPEKNTSMSVGEHFKAPSVCTKKNNNTQIILYLHRHLKSQLALFWKTKKRWHLIINLHRCPQGLCCPFPNTWKIIKHFNINFRECLWMINSVALFNKCRYSLPVSNFANAWDGPSLTAVEVDVRESVREEKTGIASFACLTLPWERPAMETTVIRF